MCLALVWGWHATHSWALFAALALYSASTALTWPAIEAALAHAPGRVPLARRAGLFNVTWSLVGSTGFFAAGTLFVRDPEAVFWAPLAAHALEIAWIALRTTLPSRSHARGEGAARRGGLERADRREDDAGPQRQDPAANLHPADLRRIALAPDAQARFLKSAWMANGLSYFLYGAFAALSPTLGERLGLGPRLTIWLVSTYLFTRSAAFVLFWRWVGWEYSRGWLAASLALPPAAFAALIFVPSPGAALGALAALGAMSGLAYSVSLHASLDREEGRGEGGGLHERVIGLGILLGPFAGAAGVRLLGGVTGAGSLVAALGAAVALVGLAPLVRRLKNRPGPGRPG
jgi:MFS family permease